MSETLHEPNKPQRTGPLVSEGSATTTVTVAPAPATTSTPAPVKPTAEDRLTALEKQVFGGPPPEPNYQIVLGETVTIPIAAEDAQGNVQPLPADDTFQARTNDATSLQAGIGAAGGAPALIVRGLKVATGVLAFVEDAKGLRQASMRFDVVAPPVVAAPAAVVTPNPAPVALTLNMAAATHDTAVR